LADFQALLDDFSKEDVQIIAASVDPIDKAKEMMEKAGVTYAMAYGLDAETVSARIGPYYDSERKYIHATGFLIRPDNTIEVSCYSSGPIGRFVAKDVLGLVRFYKTRGQKQ
jgi:alkyl hydroperoxide reductase subunit AhpC